jgi:hypothetical protein
MANTLPSPFYFRVCDQNQHIIVKAYKKAPLNQQNQQNQPDPLRILNKNQTNPTIIVAIPKTSIIIIVIPPHQP